MRFLLGLAAAALTMVPAMAQQAGSLPPPTPRAAEPAPPAPAPSDAATGRQPGYGERAGAAIDRGAQQTGQALERAADETGSALGRAMRWTGQQLQGAGEWTARQGERMTGQDGSAPRQ